MVWLIVLQPLHIFFPAIYWQLEGILFKWLLDVVASWICSAGYKVMETGDRLAGCEIDRAVVLVNHQTTADVPVMTYFSVARKNVVPNIMWVMDGIFKCTNFGLVSMWHRDAFVHQGKTVRERELFKLRNHIRTVYRPLERKWLILFPEGGFLYKRLAASQLYAKKNNLADLSNVTLPRIGAMYAILSEIAASQESAESPRYSSLKWIIDLTIAYPQGQPLDIVAIVTGWREPCVTMVHCRKFPASEVLSLSKDDLLAWMYARWAEKDRFLANFYATGHFEENDASAEPPRSVDCSLQWSVAVRLFYLCSFCFHYCWLSTLVQSVLGSFHF